MQSNQNFRWLIFDDGSTDNTRDIVANWRKDNIITIDYYYHENCGKMATLNKIHLLFNTELAICVDSDDILLVNSVNLILKTWKGILDKSEICGMVGLNCYQDQEIVGNLFPKNIEFVRVIDFQKYKIKGDKKFIYRSDILKKHKYPEIKNEHFPADSFIQVEIDLNYKLKTINQPLCEVEYLTDGLTHNIYKRYRSSPNSYMIYREQMILNSPILSEKLKHSIHYVSSSIFANKINTKFMRKKIVLLAIIPGIFLNLFIKYKTL